MAKAKKPEHVLQHANKSAPQIAPRIPDNTQKPGAKRKRIAKTRSTENMTEIRWRNIVSATANGATRQNAAKKAGVSVQTIDAYLISNVSAYKQLRDAQLLWNRRAWPTELLEAMFNDLAMGDTLKGAAERQGITDRNKLASLYRVVRKDKAIRAMYDEARELQAESFIDEVLTIADDSGNDRLENGRINHEAVNRSKLRLETRWRVMGAMVKKRFGDHKHVEIDGNLNMNHIATLTGARKRLENAKAKTEKPKPEPIEGEAKEVATA
jgi:hypothetical protein